MSCSGPWPPSTPTVTDYRRNLAVSHGKVGGLLEATGDLAGALAEHRKGQELMRVLATEHPEVLDYRHELATSHGWVGYLLEKTGDLAGALAERRSDLEMRRRWLPSIPKSPATAATWPPATIGSAA